MKRDAAKQGEGGRGRGDRKAPWCIMPLNVLNPGRFSEPVVEICTILRLVFPFFIGEVCELPCAVAA